MMHCNLCWWAGREFDPHLLGPHADVAARDPHVVRASPVPTWWEGEMPPLTHLAFLVPAVWWCWSLFDRRPSSLTLRTLPFCVVVLIAVWSPTLLFDPPHIAFLCGGADRCLIADPSLWPSPHCLSVWWCWSLFDCRPSSLTLPTLLFCVVVLIAVWSPTLLFDPPHIAFLCGGADRCLIADPPLWPSPHCLSVWWCWSLFDRRPFSLTLPTLPFCVVVLIAVWSPALLFDPPHIAFLCGGADRCLIADPPLWPSPYCLSMWWCWSLFDRRPSSLTLPTLPFCVVVLIAVWSPTLLFDPPHIAFLCGGASHCLIAGPPLWPSSHCLSVWWC